MPENTELAGDRMTITDHDDGSATIKFDDKGTGRACGSCTLCCKLLPIPTLNKTAGERCKYQRTNKGCTIYSDRPLACRVWSCRWMADRDTKGMHRPDRAHYVIDIAWDYITVRPASGEDAKMTVLQVWVDPSFPAAYKSPELRAFMQHVADKYRAATLVRFGSGAGAIIVLAPGLHNGEGWIEDRGISERRDPPEPLLTEVTYVS
jgi:hypothetical protein